MPTNLDTLQIEIKSSATDASSAIKNLVTSLKSLNKQLGLKNGTQLVNLLDAISGSATNVSAKLNGMTGSGFDKVTKGAETAQKAIQQLKKDGEDLQKTLEGFHTPDLDKAFGLAYSKKRILGEDAAKGNPKITETGFTIPNWDDSAPQRVAEAVQNITKKAKDLNKEMDAFHFPDFGNELKEADTFGKIANQAQNASNSIGDAVENIRKFKALISGMESGKLKFNESDYARYIKGLNEAETAVKNYKKSLTEKAPEATPAPTFMGDMLPKLLILGESIEKISAKFDSLANKGIKLFKMLTTPLKMAAQEYVEKFEHMKAQVEGFKKSLQANLNKMSQFWKRTMKTFTFMLVRKAITAIITEVKNAVNSMAMFSNAMGTQFNNSISTLVADFQYLGRSIVSVFAPLINYVAPIIDAIIDKIATLLSYIGMLMAALTGAGSFTKAKKNVGNYAESLDKASKSAKNLTMGIDELNIIKDKKSGGASAVDGWEDAWEEVDIPDWIKNLSDKLKKIFKDLFDPIKKAWDKARDYVLDGWKYMTSQMIKLLEDVGDAFMRAWKSDTVEHIFYNLFMILGDIENVIGNIAKRFDEAWVNGDKGYKIFKNIFEIIDILVQHLRNVTEYMVEWSDSLNFNPLLESVITLTDAFKELADFLGGVFEDVMKNVVLKYIKWMIEDAIPHLNHTIAEIIESFDFEKIRKNLEPLEKAFETLLENIHTGTTNAFGNLGKQIGEFTSSDEFGDFLNRIAEIMNKISAEDVEKILTGIGKGILSIADAIVKFVNSDLFMAFIDAIDKWLEGKSADDIAGILTNLAVAIGAFKFTAFAGKGAAECIKFLTTIKTLKDLGTIAKSVGETGSAIEGLGAGLKTAGGIGMLIGGSITALTSFIDMWKNGWHIIGEILKDIGIAIAAVGAVILGIATGPVAALVAAIVAVLSTIVILVHDHWEEICAFFTETIPAWWNDTALPFLQDIPGNLSELFANIWETVTSWAADKASAIAEWFSSVGEKISEFINKAGEYFAELPGKIGYALGYALGQLVQWGIDLVTWAITNIPIFIENIVTWFTTLPERIGTWLTEVIAKFVEWGASVVTWIAENVSQFIENIVTFFTELPGKIATWLTEVITKFTEWKTSVITWITTEVPKIISDFMKFFEEIPQKLYNLGTDIINGLINGIKNAWEGLKSGVSNFCSSFVQGFRDALDINSPSKEAEDIGDYWIQGLVLPFTHSNIDTQVIAFCQRFISLFETHLKSDRFTQIGTNVIKGLFDAMTNSLGTLNAFVARAFSSLTQLVSTNLSVFGANLTSSILPGFITTYILPFFNMQMWQPLFTVLNEVFMTQFEAFSAWFEEAMTKWWEEGLLVWFADDKWNEDLFEPLKENIQSHWETFSSWWDTTMSEWWENQVKPWFAKELWKEQLNTIADTTKEVFEKIVEIIKEYMEKAVEVVAESCEEMINALEEVASTLENVMTKMQGFDGFSGKTSINIGAKKFATGGFPTRGSLFWAGEGRGVEMVGSVGGRTGVVSNDEITGIADAVYATGNNESELLGQLIQIAQAMLSKDPVVISDKDIARMNNSGQSKLGMSIIS